MLARLLVALVSAGCNQFYGLDDNTRSAGEGDTDGDGVLDSADNCIRVANPGQEDVDGDAKGDACALICMEGTRTNKDLDRDRVDDGCDPCPRSPQQDADGHILDEDGDGAYDACDNCPGFPNADQANSDGDALGDACDGMFGHHERLVFDPYWQRQPYWAANGWTYQGGAVKSVGGISDMRMLGVELIYTDHSWVVEVGIELPADTSTNGQFGFDFVGLNVTVTCLVGRTAAGWVLVARAASASPAMELPVTSGLIRLRGQYVQSGESLELQCEAAGKVARALTPKADAVSAPFRLVASRPVVFTYVDVAN